MEHIEARGKTGVTVATQGPEVTDGKHTEAFMLVQADGEQLGRMAETLLIRANYVFLWKRFIHWSSRGTRFKMQKRYAARSR